MKYEIPLVRNTNPKPRLDENALGFAKYFTDHLFCPDINIAHMQTGAVEDDMGWTYPLGF